MVLERMSFFAKLCKVDENPELGMWLLYGVIIILSALAIAFAVSFGIGGREFASHMLEKLEKRIDNKKK